MRLLLFFWLLLPVDCYSKEPKQDFTPFDFLKVGVRPGDLPSLYRTITGGKNGGNILKSCGTVALIEFNRFGITEPSGFSFRFDEKVVTRYAIVERSKGFELCDELRDEETYGESRYEHAHSDLLAKDWANPIGIELSDGVRFLRVYFTNDFSHCGFVSCTGETTGSWALAPKVTKRIKALADGFRIDSDGKGAGMPSQSPPANPSSTPR